jgi:sugar phosphate isomerase/epimerase
MSMSQPPPHEEPTVQPTRREWLAGAGAILGGVLAAPAHAADAKPRPADEPFGYCLNTSTIRTPKLTLPEKIDIAAKAGYHGIEPWVSEVDQYVKEGGDLKELAKRIRASGLQVESTIGFFEWVLDDDGKRKKALEQAKRDMELVAQIGAKRIAAPAVGATMQTDLDLRKAAERYRALLEIGDQTGVVPQVELWGHSKSLNRLGDVSFIAIESGHPKACMLLDVYHLYKGGSGYDGLRLVSGQAFHVIHANDYPADPPRDKITDAARVYPGDGVAPWKAICRNLRDIGFRGMLSLELFNREYWKQDPTLVARTGIDKMRALVKKSLAD